MNGDALKAHASTEAALADETAPMELIQESMVPALDKVSHLLECEEFFGLGVLAPRDVAWLWSEIVAACVAHPGVVPGADSACGFANTAMQLASQKMLTQVTTPDAAKRMLRDLLETRFKLVAHETTAPAPANGLTADKDKLKMKQSDGSGDAGCQFKPPPSDQPPCAIAYMQISRHNISMAAFVQTLHSFTYDYEPGPVLDFTGLKGTLDFELKWSNRSQLAIASADGISIYDALEKQLELKLEKRMAPRPVVTVDSVHEIPTPNSPDLATLRLSQFQDTILQIGLLRPSTTGQACCRVAFTDCPRAVC